MAHSSKRKFKPSEVNDMQKEHFEILLESMDSKFSLMLEGFSTLDKKIDDFKGELKEDISLLDVKISALSNRIDAVETNLSNRLDGVDARLDGIDARLDVMNDELIAHRNNTELHKTPRKREARKAA
jgi:hypothetical protein